MNKPFLYIKKGVIIQRQVDLHVAMKEKEMLESITYMLDGWRKRVVISKKQLTINNSFWYCVRCKSKKVRKKIKSEKTTKLPIFEIILPRILQHSTNSIGHVRSPSTVSRCSDHVSGLSMCRIADKLISGRAGNYPTHLQIGLPVFLPKSHFSQIFWTNHTTYKISIQHHLCIT